MKRYLSLIAAIMMCSCSSKVELLPNQEVPENQEESQPTEEPSGNQEESENEDDQAISAEKESWATATKASDDRAFAKDLPWEEGDKVLLLGSDENQANCGGYQASDKIICTVSKANGLKCTLTPDTPLAEGTYRAIYPVYDYVWYNFLHMSFLYEDWDELDCNHQDIVISDPVTYKEGHKLQIVMKHVCGLVDIDIYPPKTGDYSYLKLFAESPVFPGKVDYYLDRKYNIDEIASGWLNFTTLRGEGRHMEEGTVFTTMTGILPIQYDGMPMNVHLIYDDGTHYVSETVAMPSLQFGVANELEVKDFTETDEPMKGLWGDYYASSETSDYPVN